MPNGFLIRSNLATSIDSDGAIAFAFAIASGRSTTTRVTSRLALQPLGASRCGTEQFISAPVRRWSVQRHDAEGEPSKAFVPGGAVIVRKSRA